MKIEIMHSVGTKTGAEFMESLDIPSRDGSLGVSQYLAPTILKKTIPLVPSDAYCMLTITMEDLYPGPKWNYVFGWAMYQARTGVFSFARYLPEGRSRKAPLDAAAEQELLHDACHVMVHEAGHMFGMTHCTHYECTMNGFNGAFEQNQMERYLCPVCLRKLQSVIHFDVKARYQKLLDVCTELGFEERT